MNVTNKVDFNKNSKSVDIFSIDVAMKKIFININLNSRAVKYEKAKSVKLSSIEIVKILKKFKKLTQIIEEQFNSIDIIK